MSRLHTIKLLRSLKGSTIVDGPELQSVREAMQVTNSLCSLCPFFIVTRLRLVTCMASRALWSSGPSTIVDPSEVRVHSKATIAKAFKI